MSRGMPRRQRNLLEKAKESTLLALEIYNNPSTKFRVGGFVVLMIISWTSLLHSIFEKNNINYWYKKNGSRFYEKIGGEKKAWDLGKCVTNYFDQNNSIRKNIEFFIKLRDKIEHRFMPIIDDKIVGECQAFIINFQNLLETEFGESHSLLDKMFIPLQIFEGKRQIPLKSNEKKVLNFIESYRNGLETGILNSPGYSYRMYIIPKTGNHLNSSDIAVEFVKYDPQNPDLTKEIEHRIVGIKEKKVEVANLKKYRPSHIIAILEQEGFTFDHVLDDHYVKRIENGKIEGGTKLHMGRHASMRKKYKIRSSEKGKANQCQTKYCVLDESSLHGDYIYTEEWLNFLKEKELKKQFT